MHYRQLKRNSNKTELPPTCKCNPNVLPLSIKKPTALKTWKATPCEMIETNLKTSISKYQILNSEIQYIK